jgi:hypothetical protein
MANFAQTSWPTPNFEILQEKTLKETDLFVITREKSLQTSSLGIRPDCASVLQLWEKLTKTLQQKKPKQETHLSIQNLSAV